jgi:hypothetical protein
VEKLDLIALGTLSGDVILYSVIKGDIHTQLVSILTIGSLYVSYANHVQ